MSTSADAVRLVLVRRGPLPVDELGALLRTAGVELDPDALHRAVLAAGGRVVVGPDSVRWAALELPGPDARPGPEAPVGEGTTVQEMIARQHPLVLVAAVLVVLAVTALLLVGLRGGADGSPTLEYEQPTETPD